MKDFSNSAKIEFEETFFKENNVICFEEMPKYGVIEDIVFLPSDSLINGEETVRIFKNYMYLDLEKNNSLKKKID